MIEFLLSGLRSFSVFLRINHCPESNGKYLIRKDGNGDAPLSLVTTTPLAGSSGEQRYSPK
uniref:Uncharacterized protein n=1 Tax=Utricularia reniformis TaxID=192314 RepID=A0A1Y0B138_9LAMI|nr:hypothetical protein AEK19_MT0866 [Utricularia reniformis]YP_009382269.1 hypothetical protein AEK19_MT1843 [Utricularia reniformis]ART31098.1 hypothetical protein AEK19_MT0866 [Utricularia reniformis]ART32013.1 hypothetical protein AEK19_MT1843 [Utricularia reniformis]